MAQRTERGGIDCGIDCGTKRRGGGESAFGMGSPPSLCWERELPRESLRFGSGGLELARLKLIAWIWVKETQRLNILIGR